MPCKRLLASVACATFWLCSQNAYAQLYYQSGQDYSANAAAIPLSGYVLLATVPSNAGRASVEVQNQSANTLQVVRDDSTGNNQTSVLLSSGGAAGTQGGGWSSTTFKGRVRVYGPSGSQVAVDQE